MINAKSFKMADKGQFVDLHEPANRNISMPQARKLLEHRFDFVRQDAKRVLDSHVQNRRDTLKVYGEGHDMKQLGEGKEYGE